MLKRPQVGCKMYKKNSFNHVQAFTFIVGLLATVSAFGASKKVAVDFKSNAEEAILQCNGYAQNAESNKASRKDENTSAFFIRYQSDYVEGEPGEVSATFSSAEKEELFEVLVESESPRSATAKTKTSYCALYAQFLRSRYTTRKLR